MGLFFVKIGQNAGISGCFSKWPKNVDWPKTQVCTGHISAYMTTYRYSFFLDHTKKPEKLENRITFPKIINLWALATSFGGVGFDEKSPFSPKWSCTENQAQK